MPWGKTVTDFPSRRLSIFLCHAQEDKPKIRELYQRLCRESVDPWLDEVKLLPGQEWSAELPKAVHNADLVLVCLSKKSVNKRGFIQKEIALALDAAEKQPEGSIFIIPAKIEECEIPHRLGKWQGVNLFEETGWERLSLTFQLCAESLGLSWRNISLPLEDTKVSNIRGQSTIGKEHVTLAEEKFILGDVEFVKVLSGKFLIGSNHDNGLAYSWEMPQHACEIPYNFWMARYLVTNRQYDSFAKSVGIQHSMKNWKSKMDHPVSRVSWEDAIQYCYWLNSELSGDLPSGYVLRLPTEVEWEKAARGENGNEWPWGNVFDKDKCNSYESSLGDTTPIGLYSPQGDSPYGCADMAGNVWEWTHTLYKPYPYRARDGREDENISGPRVLRGGSFYSNIRATRCAFRFDYLNYLAYRGFRIVLAPRLK